MGTVSLWVVVAFAFANPVGGKEPVTVTYDSHAVSYINDSGTNSLSGPVFVASAKDISVDGTYIPPQSVIPVYKSKDECLSAITMKNSLYHKEGNITLGCQEQKIEVPDSAPSSSSIHPTDNFSISEENEVLFLVSPTQNVLVDISDMNINVSCTDKGRHLKIVDNVATCTY